LPFSIHPDIAPTELCPALNKGTQLTGSRFSPQEGEL
jgi:hypothetical protein